MIPTNHQQWCIRGELENGMRYLAIAALIMSLGAGVVMAQDSDTRPTEPRTEAAPAEEKEAGVQFVGDLEEAKKLAESEGKKLLIYFSIPN
jgi:hypothetical protein